MKYVLMFIETEQFAKDFAALAPAEKEDAYRRVYQWFEDHADKITNRGSKLQGAETATTVRLDGSVLTTDGPFIEGKEVVSGFTEIEVEDLDEALRMVKTWPACPVIEIRPVADM